MSFKRMGWESPIEIIHNDMSLKLENKILKAVQDVGIMVDKEELIKALAFDRQQYEKGYEDGLKASGFIRCKDCKWWEKKEYGNYGYCHAIKHCYYSSNWEVRIYRTYQEDFFCADAERRTDAPDV